MVEKRFSIKWGLNLLLSKWERKATKRKWKRKENHATKSIHRTLTQSHIVQNDEGEQEEEEEE